jgi:hypothetical protein
MKTGDNIADVTVAWISASPSGALIGALIQARMYVVGRGYGQNFDCKCVCTFLLCRDVKFQAKHGSWTRS